MRVSQSAVRKIDVYMRRVLFADTVMRASPCKFYLWGNAVNLACQGAFHRRKFTRREIKHSYDIGQIENAAFRENVGQL